ncbi:MAG: hypothetical protein ACRC80_26000 [Waterburya sp.]
MTNSTLVLIHGYARSGKTTLLNELENRGYTTISTSRELDYVTCEHHHLPRYCAEILRQKNDVTLQKIMHDPFITCRAIKIDVAENYFVPQFGRKRLIGDTFYNQYYPNTASEYVFFETIGGEEADIAKEVAQEYGFKETISVDVRRESELKDVDIRKLSHSHRFDNSYDTPNATCNAFLQHLLRIEESENGLPVFDTVQELIRPFDFLIY